MRWINRHIKHPRSMAGVLVCLAALSIPMCAQVPLRGSVEMTCDPLFGFVLDLKDPASRGSLVAYVAKAQLSMDGVKNTPP